MTSEAASANTVAGIPARTSDAATSFSMNDRILYLPFCIFVDVECSISAGG
jgi:hypothetical protein